MLSMRGCECPSDGAYFCRQCRELLERAGQAVLPLEAEPESSFLGTVRRAALELGYLYFHDHDSRGNTAGLPDTLLAKPGHPLYLWELKKDARSKPTIEQLTWVSVLNRCTRVEAGIYRPADWDVMLAKLTKKEPN